MALIMLETKVITNAKGESTTFRKGSPVPKEYAAAWAGKPFVGDDKKPAEK